MFDLEQLIRPNIKALKPYSSARKEYTGTKGVFLDANENPYGTLNRYPDPLQRKLKDELATLKGVSEDCIFIGNGSDEVIDLALRIFCNPGVDKALTFSPSYGMYDVSSAINDVELIKLSLNDRFQINRESVEPYLNDPTVKLIFVCSPNNPTGNCFEEADIRFLLERFSGIVIVDEAYADFSEEESWVDRIIDYPNLVVSQTFSKAWGLAAARVGMAFTNTKIIELYNRVKSPYNVSKLNQEAALTALDNREEYQRQIHRIKKEKQALINQLNQLEFVEHIYPSDANFVLLKVDNATEKYQYLIQNQVIVRNRNKLVENCIRITVGTKEENEALLNTLNQFKLNPNNA